MKPGKDQTRLRTEPTKPVPYRNGRIFFFLDALSTYRRSGNFRVIKFSCFKFSRKNIFVVQDTHENFLTGSTFPGSAIWNETTHAKSTNSLHAAFVATMQLLANY